MKKSLLLIPVALLFSACSPKIVSQKSPINNLDNKNCFVFPIKDYLETKTIGEQKLYQLSEKVLKANSFTIYHSETNECENYFFTSLTVSEKDSLVTQNDAPFPAFYGMNAGIYRYGYIPAFRPAFRPAFDIDTTTREVRSYYANYELHVGKKDGDKIATIWSGQEQKSSSSSDVEASKIDDKDYDMVLKMVQKMLLENNFQVK